MAADNEFEFLRFCEQQGARVPMGSFTQEARSVPELRNYASQFEFKHGARVLRAVRYLQRGSYGAAFVLREVLADGMLGQSYCGKFFTVEDADAQKEFDRLAKIHQRGEGGRDDPRLQHVVNVEEVWHKPRAAANPAHPGQSGVVMMEFAALGEPLDYLGVPPYGLEEHVLRRLMTHLLQGVEWLHEHEIFHRDLKPENLVMGVDGRLKLCDFGGVKVLDPDMQGGVVHTQVGVGSKMFNAPELQTGQYDRLVDSWSCGIVALVLRTCKIPVEKAAAGYRGQPLWHGASLVHTGADARPAVAEHLASGVWPGCEPSAELLDFFHYVFVAKGVRPTVQMLQQHPWFQAGPVASDAEFAQWLVVRNAVNVQRAVDSSDNAVMVSRAPEFFGALCGALLKSDPSQMNLERLARLLGLGTDLRKALAESCEDGLGSVKELSPEDCGELGMTVEQTRAFAAALDAAGLDGLQS